MRVFTFDSVDASYHALVKAIWEEGQVVSPRGRVTKELGPVTVTITNPRHRIVTHPVRRLNPGFMLGEFLWIMRGSNDLAEITHYNREWANFSDDGTTLNGAYGQRIFRWQGLQDHVLPNGNIIEYGSVINQYEHVVQLLRQDPMSRQATISIWDPIRDTSSSKDIPCTNLLRFNIRQGRLNMVTVMRSNDIWFGYPYDVFNFTMLQEVMAYELGVQLGTYTHVVDSLHLYEQHWEKAISLIDHGITDVYENYEPLSYELGVDDLLYLQEIEHETRLNIGSFTSTDEESSTVDLVTENTLMLANVIALYNGTKVKNYSFSLYDEIPDDFKPLFKQWFKVKKQEVPMEIQDEVQMEMTFDDDVDVDKFTEIEATTSDTPQVPSITKIRLETDGSLQGTSLFFDDQIVPALAKIEFVASGEVGIMLKLHQVQLDAEGNPALDSEGKPIINEFTIGTQKTPDVDK